MYFGGVKLCVLWHSVSKQTSLPGEASKGRGLRSFLFLFFLFVYETLFQTNLWTLWSWLHGCRVNSLTKIVFSVCSKKKNFKTKKPKVVVNDVMWKLCAALQHCLTPAQIPQVRNMHCLLSNKERQPIAYVMSLEMFLAASALYRTPSQRGCFAVLCDECDTELSPSAKIHKTQCTSLL